MLGMLMNETEAREMQYLIQRELDEILFDLSDERIEKIVKKALRERYKVLFSIYKRFATPRECMKYMLTKTRAKKG